MSLLWEVPFHGLFLDVAILATATGAAGLGWGAVLDKLRFAGQRFSVNASWIRKAARKLREKIFFRQSSLPQAWGFLLAAVPGKAPPSWLSRRNQRGQQTQPSMPLRVRMPGRSAL